jgi:hypothetical protein
MKYTKTETGQLAFKERSPLFSARQRTTFIMFDGVKSLEQVLTAAAGLGVTQADVDHMVAQGFLAPAAGQPAHAAPVVAAPQAQPVMAPAVVAAAGAPSDRTEQQRYAEAKNMATQITASLGLRGFMLNMSVESAAGYADLLVLLPKIQSAAGEKACKELERVLKG